ncbi:hypothetical protein S245_057415, partial [Arachis hypogaea]
KSNHTIPANKPYHCKPTPPPQGVAYCRVRRTQSSPSVLLSSFPRDPSLQPLFAVTDRGCFLELGVHRRCLLSRASVAVCLPFTFASSFAFFAVQVRSAFMFAFTRRSPFEFAFVFVWKPRCSASNTATNPRAPPSRRTALFCRRRSLVLVFFISLAFNSLSIHGSNHCFQQ